MSTISFNGVGTTSDAIQNNYPTFLIHGFVGWGSHDGANKLCPYYGGLHGELKEILTKKGFEVYTPSLSGWQSAWDRACEFWAQLNGGTVDYGKVHSEKYGHARYGRTYEKGLLEDWGKPGNHEKINIIGHSFGGPTVLVIEHLLTAGSQEERDGTPEDELSDLFKGGHGDWLHSVTTLSGTNNGAHFGSFMQVLGVVTVTDLILLMVTMLGNSKFNNFYDANMDQWGVMDDPATVKKQHLRNPFSHWDDIKNYDLNYSLDSIGYEMQVETMHRMNPMLSIDKDAYHFARRAVRSHPEGKWGRHKMNKDATLVSKIAGYISCRWRGFNLEAIPELDFNHYTDLWNDGFVTLKGQSGPKDKPNVEWEEGMDIEKGVWYNMPQENKDHLSWMGWGETDDGYIGYFEEMLNTLRCLK